MVSVASHLIEEVTAILKVTVSRMREGYAQTALTFRITYVYIYIYIKLHSLTQLRFK